MFSNRRLNSAIHLGARSPLQGGLPISQRGSGGDAAEEQPLSPSLTPCFLSLSSPLGSWSLLEGGKLGQTLLGSKASKFC